PIARAQVIYFLAVMVYHWRQIRAVKGLTCKFVQAKDLPACLTSNNEGPGISPRLFIFYFYFTKTGKTTTPLLNNYFSFVLWELAKRGA
ncbi:MAG: hypothetical protein M3Y50_10995, partial [Acidobacteriota bacterium]|nr:hypothetical protein [Acidobacteriota bacterium]